MVPFRLPFPSQSLTIGQRLDGPPHLRNREMSTILFGLALALVAADPKATTAEPGGSAPANLGAPTAAPSASSGAAPAKIDKQADNTPLALRPYRIKIWLAIDSNPRYPSALQADVRRVLAMLIDLYFARAWIVEIDAPPALASFAQPPARADLDKLCPDSDKVLWLHVGTDPGGKPGRGATVITALEYDFDFAQWGPIARRKVAASDQLPQQIFEVAYRQFRPVASVVGNEQGGAQLIVQGQALTPPDSPVPLVQPGLPFKLYRDLLNRKTKKTERHPIPHSYLIFRENNKDRITSRCDLASGLRFPMTRRSRGKSPFIAIASGLREEASTTVYFVSGKERRPVVGFEVAVQPQDRTASTVIGNTDHRGRIEVRPVQLASETEAPPGVRVLNVILRAGEQVLVSFPIVPGDTLRDPIPVYVDSLYTSVNGQLFALQEEMVDNYARFVILNKRMRIYEEKSETEKLKDVAKQINSLAQIKVFEEKLKQLRDETEEKNAALKRKELPANIRRLFIQTENLMKDPKIQGGQVEVKVEVEKVKVPNETPKPKS